MFLIKKEFVTILLMILGITIVASMFLPQFGMDYKEDLLINEGKIVHSYREVIYNFGFEVFNDLNGEKTEEFYSFREWSRGLLLFTTILSLKTISLFFLVATILVGLIHLKGAKTTCHRAPLIFIILFNFSFLLNFLSVVAIANLPKALRQPISQHPNHTCFVDGSYVRQCHSLFGSFSSDKYEIYEWGFLNGWYIGLGAMLSYILLEIPVILLLRKSTVEPKPNAPPYLTKYESKEDITPKEDNSNNIIIDSSV